MSLVLLLHFHGPWICSCVSRRLSGLLSIHDLLIELQVDGVEGMRWLHSSSLQGDGLRPVTNNLPEFTTQCDIDTAMVTKLEEGWLQH